MTNYNNKKIFTEGDILQLLEKDDIDIYNELIIMRKTDVKTYYHKINPIIFRYQHESLIEKDMGSHEIRLDPLEIPEYTNRSVIHINKYYEYSDLKYLSLKILENSRANDLPFIVSKCNVIEGKVLPSKLDYKEAVVLLKATVHFDKVSSDIQYTIFDMNESSRNNKVVKECHDDFYIFDLVTKDNKRYRIFSAEKLDYKTYVLEGTEVLIDDMANIGYNVQTKIKMPFFFLNQEGIHPKIPIFDNHQSLFKCLKEDKLNFNKLCDYIFYNKEHNKTYLHPDYFMKLVCSFLFSGNYDGYPMHLMIIAKPGTGKSTLEESLHYKIEDYQGLVEGSGSTIKSLIPSFKSTTPSQGALITANRLAVIDEFLRILIRIEPDERANQLSMLNPLLEHKKRIFGSGNCKIEGSMTARMLTVSNPVYGTSDMKLLCQAIDPSFISRNTVWYQDRNHIKSIQSGEYSKDNEYQMDQNKFYAVIDYLRSFQVKFDKNRINSFVKSSSDLICFVGEENEESPVRDVYHARYGHHANCIIDGIVKTRCISEQDISFEANDKDYESFEQIWNIMIINWGIYNNKSI